MRLAILPLLALVLFSPASAALHPQASPVEAVRAGDTIDFAIRASGSVTGSASGTEKLGHSERIVTHEHDSTFRWVATGTLRMNDRGILSGPVTMTGGGTGGSRDLERTVVRDSEGEIVQEHRRWINCTLEQETPEPPLTSARALLDEETGELFLMLTNHDSFRSNGRCQGDGAPGKILLSPFFWESLAMADDPRVKRLLPEANELMLSNTVIVTARLGENASRRGQLGGEYPWDSPLRHACQSPQFDSEEMEGRCTATGLLRLTTNVDVCGTAERSRAVHLAALAALRKPPPGSSESQVRAFAVDVRHKVNAVFADERALELQGCPVHVVSLDETNAATKLALEAWVELDGRGKISDSTRGDVAAAERLRQLTGDVSDSPAAEILGSLGAAADANAKGSAVVAVKSPVSLHAWDEQGRHVGWNATTGAPEAQVPGASYEGAPGEGQEISLPPGFYKVAIVELDAGRYMLDTAWNGTGGEGFELLPLASEKGRTVVMNVLLDHLGFVAGPAQRVATAEGGAFRFVEPWRPLRAATERGASDERPPADSDADDAHRDAPAPGAILVVALVAGVALATRRSRG